MLTVVGPRSLGSFAEVANPPQHQVWPGRSAPAVWRPQTQVWRPQQTSPPPPRPTTAGPHHHHHHQDDAPPPAAAAVGSGAGSPPLVAPYLLALLTHLELAGGARAEDGARPAQNGEAYGGAVAGSEESATSSSVTQTPRHQQGHRVGAGAYPATVVGAPANSVGVAHPSARPPALRPMGEQQALEMLQAARRQQAAALHMERASQGLTRFRGVSPPRVAIAPSPLPSTSAHAPPGHRRRDSPERPLPRRADAYSPPRLPSSGDGTGRDARGPGAGQALRVHVYAPTPPRVGSGSPPTSPLVSRSRQ